MTDEQETPSAPEIVSVRTVITSGKSALVEWHDGQTLCRCWLPAYLIVEGAVSADELALGATYGVAWERYIVITATPEKLAAELRRHGIWTLADLHEKAVLAKSVLLSAGMADFATLIRNAEKEEA